jgi:hypothetical protein
VRCLEDSALCEWLESSQARPDVDRPGDARRLARRYIRKVETLNGKLYNVEFATVEAVKDPVREAKK